MVYEEFRADRRHALSGLFDFLGLRDDVDIDVERRVNVSGLPKSKSVQSLLQGGAGLKRVLRWLLPKKQRRKLRGAIEAMNTGERIRMTTDVRRRFDSLYVNDVAYVERVLGRELPAWRELRLEPLGDHLGNAKSA